MKNLQLYALMIVLLSSCKKKDLALYSGPENIYFTTTVEYYRENWGMDGVSVSFTLTNNLQDSLIKIPVRATGKSVNKDRFYTVKINEASTAKEGIHYNFYQEDFKIPAGKLTDSIQIVLHRTPDLKTNFVALGFQLVANENFVTNMQDAKSSTGKSVSPTKFTVLSSDILQEPLSWYPTYLGVFSEKKFYLMIQVLNINPIKFSGPAFSNVQPTEVQSYGIAMQRYLNSQRAAGKIVYEADGREMVMGPSAQ